MEEKILELMEMGKSLEQAAEELGVDRSTVYRWLAKGAKGDEQYAEWYSKVIAAKSRQKAMGAMHKKEAAGL